MKAAIEINKVEVRYQRKVVLNDIHASIPQKTICGLIGMNGAGKSTLFKAIMAAVPISRGSISLFGQPIKKAQKDGLVSYVPQNETIDWNFPVSVEEVVMMGRYGFMNMFRIPSAEDKHAVDEALSKVQLSQYRHRQIGQLSGGQRKRAFVARALAQGARLLLLDEPFAGVDAKTEASLIELLRELKKGGATILISAHNLEKIKSYCDHIIFIKQQIIAAGRTKKVFTKQNIAKTFSDQPIYGRTIAWNI